MAKIKNVPQLPRLLKAPTGIQGLDEITGGGLPKGRPTLIYGSAGSGKTLISMEFLVRGALEFNEPGVFMSFEETEGELATNVASLGFDINSLISSKKLFIDQVAIERSEIEETGEYDLEGLFVRLGNAIDSIKAKRVVLDTIEVLYAGLNNDGIIRSELRRLFRWLKDRGVTTIVTGERGGETTLTRHGLEEYVSDCVIFLDSRINQELSTRRIRIVKYRGTAHSTNEFPFIIDREGISILPVTEVRLDYLASNERVSTGVPRLDAMLDGKGYMKGSAILVSGMVGTGKSSLSAHLINRSCGQGKRSLYLAFEESPDQIKRNMKSIGIDLEPWVKKGLLHFWKLVRDDSGGIKTWRLVDVNPPALRTWGRQTVDEIRGKTTDEIFGPGSTGHFMPIVQKIMTEGIPYSYEDYFPNLNKYFRFTSVPIGEYFITTGSDITEIKQNEASLSRYAHELEASNKELEAFSYSVSHDLRAPLRSITGFSTILLEDYKDELDNEGKSYLKKISDSGELMGQLMDDLLKLSRVTRSDLNFERINLSDMAHKIVDELRNDDPKRKVKVTIAPNMHANGDKNLLGLVLQNLLGNAWKYSSKTSEPRIEMGTLEHNGKRAYFVRDNGVGFDMTYADKLFKPFQRLHKATEFTGTGIGLATVQRIIRRHGGEVWAESKVGEGATFYFTLS